MFCENAAGWVRRERGRGDKRGRRRGVSCCVVAGGGEDPRAARAHQRTKKRQIHIRYFFL